MSKKNEFGNGSNSREELIALRQSILVAKELLATLELEHPFLWISKLHRIRPEHLRILLQEVMDEIGIAEQALNELTT